MGRTATKAQAAKARARQARLALPVERNARDDRAAAQASVEKAERVAAAALVLLGREKVPVRDMAALTGIGESVCARLLRLPVESHDGTPVGAGSSEDAAR